MIKKNVLRKNGLTKCPLNCIKYSHVRAYILTSLIYYLYIKEINQTKPFFK